MADWFGWSCHQLLVAVVDGALLAVVGVSPFGVVPAFDVLKDGLGQLLAGFPTGAGSAPPVPDGPHSPQDFLRSLPTTIRQGCDQSYRIISLPILSLSKSITETGIQVHGGRHSAKRPTQETPGRSPPESSIPLWDARRLLAHNEPASHCPIH